MLRVTAQSGLVGIVLLAVHGSHAQTIAPAQPQHFPVEPSPAYSAPVDAPGQAYQAGQVYTLGPGDVIAVTVLRHPEMGAPEVTVTEAGRVYLPVVGTLRVTGKTIDQVTTEIKKALRVKLLRPEVTVTLRQARPQQIFILGTVGKPGVYNLNPGWRITEALAIAGGLSVPADLADATLNRTGQKPLPIDVRGILNDSNSPANRVLQVGDTLRFEERATTIEVSVAGQVQKPGRYPIPINGTVIDAVAQAGGAIPKAALTKAVVKRSDGTTIPVNLFRVMTQGERDQDVKLQRGDMVIIPESTAKVTVLGAVQKPGFVDLEDGRSLRLAEAVAQAGGASSRAALSRAAIKHADGTNTPVDLFKIVVLGQQDGNIELAPGDVVMVPELKGITVLGDVAKPGTYYIGDGTEPRISDVLAQAGGLSVPPEAAHVSIARHTANGQSRTSSVDTVALLDLKDLSQNERVQDGDLITVSTAKAQTVFVSGEVKTPGAIQLKEGDSIPELIAKAGGPTAMASLSHISVVERDGTTQNVDAYAALQNGQKLNFPLQEGDYVIVPKNSQKVLVLQGVAQPGYYPIPENGTLTIGDALLLAGGPKDRAKLKEVAVIRQTQTGVQRRVIALDRTYEGQLAINATLQNGDIVYVPEGGGNASGGGILATLSGLSILRTLFGR